MSVERYRRRLPHWRDDNATYFVTWRVGRAQRELEPTERSIVLRALTYFDGNRYELLAAVIMNDHVHVLCRPSDEFSLQQIVHSWKSFTLVFKPEAKWAQQKLAEVKNAARR